MNLYAAATEAQAEAEAGKTQLVLNKLVIANGVLA